MSKLNSKASSQIGKPPGSLIFVGKKKIEKSRISVLSYNEKTFEEKELKNVEECFKLKNTSGVTWLNVDGLHEIDIIEKIGKHYGIHPLTLEDILNTSQRPKVEIFEDHIFIIMKTCSMSRNFTSPQPKGFCSRPEPSIPRHLQHPVQRPLCRYSYLFAHFYNS